MLWTYANKLGNLEEMDTFLEMYTLSKLSEEGRDNLSRTIIRGEKEFIIEKFTANKSPGPDGFTQGFYQTYKKRSLLKLFQKI